MPRRRRGWALNEDPQREERHSPLKISLLEPALLILIHEEARHGYSLLASLEGLGLSTLHPSVVYRTLREMESLGWVESDWDHLQAQGPPRRIYRMTPLGSEALINWQRELVDTQSLIAHLLKKIS